MDPYCLRHTELPGTSKLFAHFLYDFARVADFFSSPPFDFEAYRRAAEQVNYPAARRAAVVEAIRSLNFGSPLLEQFAQPDTVAVVTGQQVGLYGGPCYTFYKALTAVSIARQLDAAGQPAVPVFWLATEDHDLAEANHTWIYGAGCEPVKLEAEANAQPQQTVGGIEITAAGQGRLRETLAPFPHGEAVAAIADRAYRPGKTLGNAFRELLREVLGEYAVLFIDPLPAGIRRVAAPLLAEAAARHRELSAAVYEKTQELLARGYHSQVLVESPEASLFFLLEDNRRVPLKKNGIANEAEKLSPNALLRPVMQDYLLPTAVMVGGPAEIAYLAQSAPLYDRLLGRRPALTARAGFTLLDARAAKWMQRYGLRVLDVLQPFERFRETVAGRLVPPRLRQIFDSTGARLRAPLEELHAAVSQFDPTLGASLAKSRAKIEYQLEKSRAKVAREILRRDSRAAQEAGYLANLIYPYRHLQERFYSILPFLAQHGPGLIGRIYENIQVSCADHHVLAV